MTTRQKLIEVALPLDAINKAVTTDSNAASVNLPFAQLLARAE